MWGYIRGEWKHYYIDDNGVIYVNGVDILYKESVFSRIKKYVKEKLNVL